MPLFYLGYHLPAGHEYGGRYPECFLSLGDRMVLMQLEPGLTGFSPTQASDYEELERQIDAAKTFDAP